MSNNESILGCFVKISADSTMNNEQQVFEKGRLFRTYIWGEKGIDDKLKQLKNSSYGKDLELILVQFYVYALQDLKPFEYRKREKSISIPVVINDENFFNLSDVERYDFLIKTLLAKIDLLTEVVKEKKLDTNIELLKLDLKKILEELQVR
jgi:hypothetical protein